MIESRRRVPPRPRPKDYWLTDHARQRARERHISVKSIRFILAVGHRYPAPGLNCWCYLLPAQAQAEPRLAPWADLRVITDDYAGCVVTVRWAADQSWRKKPGNRATGCQAPISHPSPGNQNLRIYPPHSGPGDPSRALPAPLGDGAPAAANGGPGVDVVRTTATEGGGGYPRLAMDGEPSVPLSQDTTPAEFFSELGRIERKFRLIGLGLCGLSALVVLGVFAGVVATLAQLFL